MSHSSEYRESRLEIRLILHSLFFTQAPPSGGKCVVPYRNRPLVRLSRLIRIENVKYGVNIASFGKSPDGSNEEWCIEGRSQFGLVEEQMSVMRPVGRFGANCYNGRCGSNGQWELR